MILRCTGRNIPATDPAEGFANDAPLKPLETHHEVWRVAARSA